MNSSYVFTSSESFATIPFCSNGLPHLALLCSDRFPAHAAKSMSRRRGVVLTQQGWQKLLQAGVLHDKSGRRVTYEELSERSLLDPRTISRILGCEVKVDKRTLTIFFQAFGLELQAEDYTLPKPLVSRQEQQGTDNPYAHLSFEELIALRRQLKEDYEQVSRLLGFNSEI